MMSPNTAYIQEGKGFLTHTPPCFMHSLTLSKITQQDQNVSGLAQALLCLWEGLLLPHGISHLTGMIKTKRLKIALT